MLPAIDRAAGPARAAVRVAVGSRALRQHPRRVAQEAVDRTDHAVPGPRVQPPAGDKIRALVAQRTKELPPRDFVEMMRAAIKEDEWMLYAHGAIMGFGGGVLHLLIFGVGA